MGEPAKKELPYELSFSDSPLSLGLIIPRGLCVSGHVVRAIFVSDTSPKRIDQEGLGRRSSGTRHGEAQE